MKKEMIPAILLLASIVIIIVGTAVAGTIGHNNVIQAESQAGPQLIAETPEGAKVYRYYDGRRYRHIAVHNGGVAID